MFPKKVSKTLFYPWVTSKLKIIGRKNNACLQSWMKLQNTNAADLKGFRTVLKYEAVKF